MICSLVSRLLYHNWVRCLRIPAENSRHKPAGRELSQLDRSAAETAEAQLTVNLYLLSDKIIGR
uniref:Uncharacterized protein n=1 Tax=Faecalibaculum rodentium TaxID=1702221 RepID=A0A140DVU3_9FIRM|nr:hypothetical protein AALO17_16360 [Faecalibaculum rodentium]